MSLGLVILTVGEVCFVLGFFGALLWSDHRTAVRAREPIVGEMVPGILYCCHDGIVAARDCPDHGRRRGLAGGSD